MTTEQTSTSIAAGGELAYTTKITADTIKVTFNGVEYTCQKMSENDYGAPYNGSTNTYDWSEYPFNIAPIIEGSELVTETAGTYSVKIEVTEETATTTSCFQKAVESLTSPLPVTLTKRIINATDESPTETPEGSQSDIINALEGGRMVYLVDPNGHKYLVIGYSTPTGFDPSIEVMDNVDGVIQFGADGSKFYYPQGQA